MIFCTSSPVSGSWPRLRFVISAISSGSSMVSVKALRKAAQLNPEDARTQMQLARALLDEGGSADALSAANRALDLAPWHPAMIETLATVAAALGKCPEALKLGKRADRIFSDWYRDGSNQAHKRYLQLEERCAKSVSR